MVYWWVWHLPARFFNFSTALSATTSTPITGPDNIDSIASLKFN